jgi:ABC-type amino acid transport system permease subunit
MVGILKIIAAITNNLHDLLVKLSAVFGLTLNDKQLHFIVIAVIGMFIYIVVDKLFKAMSKYSISIVSFIYTFTVLVVIVLAIEVEQKITKRGNMELSDITAGLWGFLVVFTVYIIMYNLIRFTIKSIKKAYAKKNIARDID